jgi:hypothetical protein
MLHCEVNFEKQLVNEKTIKKINALCIIFFAVKLRGIGMKRPALWELKRIFYLSLTAKCNATILISHSGRKAFSKHKAR